MLSYSSAGSGGAGGLDSPLEFFEPPCMKIVPTPLLLYGNAFWGGLGVILAGGPAYCRYATGNCLCVVAERATKKFTIFVAAEITLLRAEFEIFSQRFS